MEYQDVTTRTATIQAADAVRRASIAWRIIGLQIFLALGVSGCTMTTVGANGVLSTASPGTQSLVVYSGRSENLIAPLIEQFEEQTGVQTDVRYGGTSEMAATIIEEGDNSPADVFFAQDAGSLGALAKSQRLVTLPDAVLSLVPSNLRSPDGEWVGVSGRARVLAYNIERVAESELPRNVWELTEDHWRGKVGWAPTNGSFQSFVTALRLVDGEDQAAQWLAAMLENDVQSFPNNTAIIDAVASGEIDVGLVNHYYLYRFLEEQGAAFPVRNHNFAEPGAGSIVNVAGVGIVDTASNPDAAEKFVEFLLSADAQAYFADETMEYPLASTSSGTPEGLVPLSELRAPSVDLSDLNDLQGTLDLLQESGALD